MVGLIETSDLLSPKNSLDRILSTDNHPLRPLISKALEDENWGLVRQLEDFLLEADMRPSEAEKLKVLIVDAMWEALISLRFVSWFSDSNDSCTGGIDESDNGRRCRKSSPHVELCVFWGEDAIGWMNILDLLKEAFGKNMLTAQEETTALMEMRSLIDDALVAQ